MYMSIYIHTYIQDNELCVINIILPICISTLTEYANDNMMWQSLRGTRGMAT